MRSCGQTVYEGTQRRMKAETSRNNQVNMSSNEPYSPIPDDEIPVLVSIFNRPDKIRAVISNLRQVKPKRLFISADGPRPGKPEDKGLCEAARQTATAIDWDCDLRTRFLDRNIGVDAGVASAIQWFFEQVEYGIILEDDCLVHPDFFRFCGELLVRYSDDLRIMQISSLSPYPQREHPYDYHFSRMFRCSGGWATWRRAWKLYSSDMSRYSDEEVFAIMRGCNLRFDRFLLNAGHLSNSRKASRTSIATGISSGMYRVAPRVGWQPSRSIT